MLQLIIRSHIEGLLKNEHVVIQQSCKPPISHERLMCCYVFKKIHLHTLFSLERKIYCCGRRFGICFSRQNYKPPIEEIYYSFFSPSYSNKWRINAVLKEIKTHFKSHSKEHYSRKYIMPIGNPEISDVKENKLNVCTLYFDRVLSIPQEGVFGRPDLFNLF